MKSNDICIEDLPAAEAHPLKPFLPVAARVLMLGTFPPGKAKWSMEFFYPNFQNDMWRIMGMVFFGDRDRFVAAGRKAFDEAAVRKFCDSRGIAFSDTAAEVVRTRGNASDKYLEVVRPLDLEALLGRLPECRAVAVTGQKAAETLAAVVGCVPPPQNGATEFVHQGRRLKFYRLPSTSRAYPKPLDEKAEAYRAMFAAEGYL